MCSVCRLPPTIAASPEDYIWRRCLPGAGAEGVQAVEGIIAAVSRGRQGVTTLGIPAVDVTTVSDTPLRTLKVLGLLGKNKPSNKRQTLEQHTRSLPHYRKTSLQWPPKIPASSVHRNRLWQPVIERTIIYKPTFQSPTLPCCNFPNQKNHTPEERKIPRNF